MVPAGFSRSSPTARELGLDLVEARAERVQETLAGCGRRDAARGAGQKPDAEPGLEFAHGVAQRRLRHAEPGRGFGEALLPRHGEEGHKVIQMAALHLWFLLISPCRL